MENLVLKLSRNDWRLTKLHIWPYSINMAVKETSKHRFPACRCTSNVNDLEHSIFSTAMTQVIKKRWLTSIRAWDWRHARIASVRYIILFATATRLV